MKITRRRFFGIMNQVGQAFLLATGLASCGDFGIDEEQSGIRPPHPTNGWGNGGVPPGNGGVNQPPGQSAPYPTDGGVDPYAGCPYDGPYDPYSGVYQYPYPYCWLTDNHRVRPRFRIRSEPLFERLTDYYHLV